MSAPPPPVGEAADSSDAGMEGRQGVLVPRQRGAVGNAALGSPGGGPLGGGPQEQEEEEEVYGEGAPHEGSGSGGGLGLPASGNEKEFVVLAEEDAGARVPGRAVAEGRPAGRNTCCICLQPWAADDAHRVCCIPCGHVYGRSCLFRWLIQSTQTVAKCPLCGEQYKYDSIIDIYATTEHLWDDCHHKQESSQGAMEEEALREVMDSALEEIARRDEVIARRDEMIAQMEEMIAEMIAKMKISNTEWISKMEISNTEWKTLIDDMRATLKKYSYALRACVLLLCMVFLWRGVPSGGST